ncbi:class I SAM-dependent methyltransferase [Virgibacillus oceani]|uniref:SAM-dependent methyltransferase n=1 Tax=Virgibacillus oceani TaxID=1479511 RepID=A0A917HF11_9BACI|nr:class I SAM-dependent methyltransferase [Virgibacillus oceani]GGG76562.1 SAM-dependent methyltransferase [Virgibacillus oceani]
MNKEIINSIVESMAPNAEMAAVQRIQTEHRVKLAQFWNIQKGHKVLEIGCGQGDTTVVLAHFAGEEGLVHGIDIGPSDYGSPITLGESADYIMKSTLGKQIQMEFEVDPLSPEVDFPENFFDCIILSHCSWYFKSFEELQEVLQKVKKWGKRLCFAEWDTAIQSIEQYPHLLAILIQAQYESFKQNSDSNVRTLLTRDDCRLAAENAGWNILNDSTIFSPELQDATWEIDQTISGLDMELCKSNSMPDKLERLIRSEISMLQQFITSNTIIPLSVFAFVAE